MAVRGTISGIDSPEALEKALRAAYYLADDGIATAAYLALALGKPQSTPRSGQLLAKAIRTVRTFYLHSVDKNPALESYLLLSHQSNNLWRLCIR